MLHRTLINSKENNKEKSLVFTLVASKLAWTAGLGHPPNFKTWALAAKTDSRAKEITCMAFILSPQPAENKTDSTVTETISCPRTQSTKHKFWKSTTEAKNGRQKQKRQSHGCSPFTCMESATTCVQAIGFWGTFIDWRTCDLIIDHIFRPLLCAFMKDCCDEWVWELAPVQMITLFKQASHQR